MENVFFLHLSAIFAPFPWHYDPKSNETSPLLPSARRVLSSFCIVSPFVACVAPYFGISTQWVYVYGKRVVLHCRAILAPGPWYYDPKRPRNVNQKKKTCPRSEASFFFLSCLVSPFVVGVAPYFGISTQWVYVYGKQLVFHLSAMFAPFPWHYDPKRPRNVMQKKNMFFSFSFFFSFLIPPVARREAAPQHRDHPKGLCGAPRSGAATS